MSFIFTDDRGISDGKLESFRQYDVRVLDDIPECLTLPQTECASLALHYRIQERVTGENARIREQFLPTGLKSQSFSLRFLSEPLGN